MKLVNTKRKGKELVVTSLSSYLQNRAMDERLHGMPCDWLLANSLFQILRALFPFKMKMVLFEENCESDDLLAPSDPEFIIKEIPRRW